MFELMAEAVRDYAIFLLDADGCVSSWNLGAKLIKQYSREEIFGQHFSVFYTPEDIARQWPHHELKVARAEGRFTDKGWRVRKDGSRFWADVTITALRDADGKLLGFSKITRDLSEQKAHDEQLRQSEERFRLLVEGVEDYAIYLLSPEGVVTSWNAGARRIKGYEGSEIVGRNFSRFFTAEDIDAASPGPSWPSRAAWAIPRTRAGACARMARASGRVPPSPRCTTRPAARCAASPR
jgi:PAS domain S-box-containing protein